MKIQQQRGQDAKLSIFLQLQLPGPEVPKEGVLGSFQPTQAAVLHVTLPPLMELTVRQAHAGACSVQRRCLPSRPTLTSASKSPAILKLWLLLYCPPVLLLLCTPHMPFLLCPHLSHRRRHQLLTVNILLWGVICCTHSDEEVGV